MLIDVRVTFLFCVFAGSNQTVMKVERRDCHVGLDPTEVLRTSGAPGQEPPPLNNPLPSVCLICYTMGDGLMLPGV